MKSGKGLIRAANKQGVASGKTAVAERSTGRLKEPTACERCGAVFSGRTWRRDHPVTAALLDRAVWKRCPACTQRAEGTYWGRVVIRGAFVAANEAAIRQRVLNVAEQAEGTQPMRRLVAMERDGEALEVLTTSQKLAHRVARELKKAFRGRATYKWSDDGSLYAVWERD